MFDRRRKEGVGEETSRLSSTTPSPSTFIQIKHGGSANNHEFIKLPHAPSYDACAAGYSGSTLRRSIDNLTVTVTMAVYGYAHK